VPPKPLLCDRKLGYKLVIEKTGECTCNTVRNFKPTADGGCECVAGFTLTKSKKRCIRTKVVIEGWYWY
jgi:hypothetical protein